MSRHRNPIVFYASEGQSDLSTFYYLILSSAILLASSICCNLPFEFMREYFIIDLITLSLTHMLPNFSPPILSPADKLQYLQFGPACLVLISSNSMIITTAINNQWHWFCFLWCCLQFNIIISYLVLLNNRFIYYQFLVTLLMGIYGIIVDDPFIKVGSGPFIMLDNALKVGTCS